VSSFHQNRRGPVRAARARPVAPLTPRLGQSDGRVRGPDGRNPDGRVRNPHGRYPDGRVWNLRHP
jgi:hypothetical protein